MFGNADANNPDEWIKIMYNISPGKLFNETTGRFGNSNNTLTCLGIVTGLVIDLYHSKINFERLLNQEKILAVTYAFGGIINKTFDYDKRDNSVYLELDLHSQVVYYDISVQKQEIFVDPPSLEIKLPYDFFYPFVKIENGVDKISSLLNFEPSDLTGNDVNPFGCPSPSSPEERANCRYPVKCRSNEDCPYDKQCCPTSICGETCVNLIFTGYK
ncbi:hypothetical protein NQ318_004099 [Aromia moschata]|uniref:WAP domain-containing protein n=1 Tax=Aromia moschata TaxID=1265417 RepID=A0AAV8XTR5_9CUCU|nr:hypothetical protein NQ318_004099 [Aromia moschata]